MPTRVFTASAPDDGGEVDQAEMYIITMMQHWQDEGHSGGAFIEAMRNVTAEILAHVRQTMQ